MHSTKLRIDHLAFPSFNASKTYRFYTEVMRFRLVFAVDGESAEWGGRPYLVTGFAFAGGEIHFFDVEGIKRPKGDGLPKDIRHIALSVASRAEITSWKKRLDAHGVPYWVEDHDGSPSMYFSDPNGVMFEITYHPQVRHGVRAAAEARAVVRRWTARRQRASRPVGGVRRRRRQPPT